MAVNDPTGDTTPTPDAPSGDTWLTKQTPEVQSYVQSLRKENAGNRVKLRETEGKLTKLSDADKTIRDLRIGNQLLRHGAADPEMVEFFLKKEGKWDDIDPDDADGMKDRVDDLIARRPELKQQRSALPRRSGTDGSTGGSGGPASNQVTRSQLANMSPEQVERALHDGNLNAILGRG